MKYIIRHDKPFEIFPVELYYKWWRYDEMVRKMVVGQYSAYDVYYDILAEAQKLRLEEEQRLRPEEVQDLR